MECLAFDAIRQAQTKRGASKRQLWLRFCVRALLSTAKAEPIEQGRDLLGLASPTLWEPDAESLRDAAVVIAALGEAGAEDVLGSLPTAEEVCELLVKFGANTISCEGQDAEGSWRLYVGTTATNHSCRPNAEWYFPPARGGRVEIRAISSIGEGEEVTVSYVDTAAIPIEERAR